MKDEPFVLGVNAAYHESAAAIVRGAEVIFAVEEERLTRVKHGKKACVTNPDVLPWAAIRSCLAAADARATDLDCVAYSLNPGLRTATVGLDPYPVDEALGFGTERGEREFDARIREVPGQLARVLEEPSLAARVRFVPHHVAHAASAFYASPFEAAAVLVVDGIGERATAWLGRGRGTQLEAMEEVLYPHSLGLLWERVALFLGFTEFDAPKVMGLAALGDPARFAREVGRLLQVPDPEGGRVGDGQPPFLVDAGLARFRAADVAGLETLFGPRRGAEPPETQRFADLAAALQQRTEEALLAICGRLARATGDRALAYAGGTALNCVANARLEVEGPFDALYVPSAAHDAGTALGAALETAFLAGARAIARHVPLTPFLGPAFDEATIDAALSSAGLTAERLARPELVAAKLVASGRIVGWFQGRLEFGPRALGNRSLLADPRRPEIREEINRRIKHRETYRPFAASVLAESASEWFCLPAGGTRASASRDLMLLAYPIVPARRGEAPAVIHADGTCRVQLVERARSPVYHGLIARFAELTGVPLVLNTSFNDNEPIVCSPADAVATFLKAGVDDLVLGDRLVRRGS